MSDGRKGPLLIALVGNPNTGKTSVFNMLTGARHRVGNYPGVTVEKVTGRLTGTSLPIEILDLPMIVSDTLLGRQRGVEKIAAAVVIADASNLDRNLFLTTQVLETGVPVVVALNMMDIAARNRIHIDANTLSQRLGAVVVPVQARNGTGRTELVRAIEVALRWAWVGRRPSRARRFP